MLSVRLLYLMPGGKVRGSRLEQEHLRKKRLAQQREERLQLMTAQQRMNEDPFFFDVTQDDMVPTASLDGKQSAFETAF